MFFGGGFVLKYTQQAVRFETPESVQPNQGGRKRIDSLFINQTAPVQGNGESVLVSRLHPSEVLSLFLTFTCFALSAPLFPPPMPSLSFCSLRLFNLSTGCLSLVNCHEELKKDIVNMKIFFLSTGKVSALEADEVSEGFKVSRHDEEHFSVTCALLIASQIQIFCF